MMHIVYRCPHPSLVSWQPVISSPPFPSASPTFITKWPIMADPSTATFAEKVFALSKVIHTVKFRNEIAATYTDHQQKQLRLLDDIALLLVTEPSSDVAAVSFERREEEVLFYYAKNRPATTAEHEHIQSLISAVQAEGTADDRLRAMLAKVLDICRPKIHSRLRKIKSIISKTSGMKYVHDDPEDEVHQYFKQRLGDWYDACPTATVFLEGFMSNLDSLEVRGCVGDQLSLLIELAHITSSFKPVTAVFPDLELAKRIRLLGDYFGAVARIVKYFDTIRPNSPVQVKITFIEVGFNYALMYPKANQTPGPCFTAAANILPNGLSPYYEPIRRRETPSLVDYPALTRAYPRHTPFVIGGKPEQSVTQCVHAECTLAVYLTKLGHRWEHIEIGCSKGSCWLCETYLTNYGSVLKFHVSNVHGKLQPGWTIPAGGDSGSKEHILALIDDEIQEVLHRAHNSKKSDSEPCSGRESNGENRVSAKRAARPDWFIA